jgi:hypothetical protein
MSAKETKKGRNSVKDSENSKLCKLKSIQQKGTKKSWLRIWISLVLLIAYLIGFWANFREILSGRVWLWAACWAVFGAAPILYGRYLLGGCFLAGFLAGMFSHQWLASAHRPGLSERTFPVFVLYLLFFAAFGILAEFAIYFAKAGGAGEILPYPC